MTSILCDINIFLDIFLAREPFYRPAAEVFKAVEERHIRGYICALSFPTLFYILAKELSRQKALKTLEKIRIVYKVAPVTQKTVDLALVSEFKDFEDAVQYYSAVTARVDYLVTRNKVDYVNGKLPVLLPEELLALDEI